MMKTTTMTPSPAADLLPFAPGAPPPAAAPPEPVERWDRVFPPVAGPFQYTGQRWRDEDLGAVPAEDRAHIEPDPDYPGHHVLSRCVSLWTGEVTYPVPGERVADLAVRWEECRSSHGRGA